MASYEVVGTGGAWHLKQDGEPIGTYPSKEAAFEAAVAAALEIIREGTRFRFQYPGSVSTPDRRFFDIEGLELARANVVPERAHQAQ